MSSSTVLLKWQDVCEGYVDSGKTLKEMHQQLSGENEDNY